MYGKSNSQKQPLPQVFARSSLTKGLELTTWRRSTSPEDLGAFIRKESAAAIGLIPAELVAKVKVIGNGAGKGAVMALTSRKHLEALDRISGNARYIELSSSPMFQQAYIEEMVFPAPGAVTSRPKS